MDVSPQHKGKRGELLVFAELMRKGAEVYVPLVDMGIDAIVRRQDGDYLEVHIKARAVDEEDLYFSFEWEPRPNRVFICVSLKGESPTVWVLPCQAFKKYAREDKRGWHLSPSETIRGDRSGKTRAELLEEYCVSKNPDAWKPLLPPA